MPRYTDSNERSPRQNHPPGSKEICTYVAFLAYSQFSVNLLHCMHTLKRLKNNNTHTQFSFLSSFDHLPFLVREKILNCYWHLFFFFLSFYLDSVNLQSCIMNHTNLHDWWLKIMEAYSLNFSFRFIMPKV